MDKNPLVSSPELFGEQIHLCSQYSKHILNKTILTWAMNITKSSRLLLNSLGWRRNTSNMDW